MSEEPALPGLSLPDTCIYLGLAATLTLSLWVIRHANPVLFACPALVALIAIEGRVKRIYAVRRRARDELA